MSTVLLQIVYSVAEPSGRVRAVFECEISLQQDRSSWSIEFVNVNRTDAELGRRALCTTASLNNKHRV
ncbi:Conotoxin Gla(3)-TxVI [Trichinella pseudospiralis]